MTDPTSFTTRGKIFRADQWDALCEELGRRRAAGEAIVFTNGCFDLIHVGHIRLLEWAKAQGDVLVVGLNSDASVTRLKGPGRPKLPEAERLRVMGAIACVDFATVFEQDTPREIIETLAPDVLVKGADWRGREIGIVGEEFINARGGRTVAFPLVEGKSTTAIIERAAKREGEKP